jgi:preprotein translocase subunit SecG
MILASAGITILSISLVIVSVLMAGLILLQKNRGAGLSGAFGGVGGHSAFGTKTGDMLTWVTVGLAVVFLFLSALGNFVFVPETPLAGLGNAPAPEGETSAPPTGATQTPGAPAQGLPAGAPAGAPPTGKPNVPSPAQTAMPVQSSPPPALAPGSPQPTTPTPGTRQPTLPPPTGTPGH